MALEQDIQKILNEYGQQFTQTLKQNLEPHRASGSLIQSIQFRTNIMGTEVTLQILGNDYLEWVDQGRAPGSKPPPVTSILQWINTKGIKATARNGKIPTNEQLAFLISNSIGSKGIKATNVIRNTTVQVGDKYIVDITNALEKNVQQMTKETLETNPNIKTTP